MDRDYLQYRLADIVCRSFPRRFVYWIGLRLADTYYVKDAKGRSAVVSNLRHILEYEGLRPSEETLLKMARRTFQYFGKYLVDFFRFSMMTRREVDRIVTFENLEYIEKARSVGKGTLVISAHLGSSEIGAAALTGLGYPVSAVVLPEENEKTRDLFRHRRESRGVNVIPLGEGARGTLRALRRKEFVGLMADRDYGHQNHNMVNLFGSPVHLPRGPATLCVRTGAPILPLFLLREADDTYRCRFHPPFVPTAGTRTEEVQDMLCRILEKEIGAHPTQWFMFEQFWNNGDR